MIYLTLHSVNFKETREFYCTTLSLFKAQSDTRLICLAGELILNLDDSCPCSEFAIHIGDKQITILKTLDKAGVVYSFEINIAGEFLEFKDPSGNKVGIWAHGGSIK